MQGLLERLCHIHDSFIVILLAKATGEMTKKPCRRYQPHFCKPGCTVADQAAFKA